MLLLDFSLVLGTSSVGHGLAMATSFVLLSWYHFFVWCYFESTLWMGTGLRQYF